MSSNFMKLKQPVQMATSMKVPAMTSASLMSNFNKTGATTKAMTFKQTIYERAIGQHLYKTTPSHTNPTRYGDFEVSGRVSDF